jgi:hypothetical protein
VTIPVATPHVDGTAMVADEIYTSLDLWRGWLNQLVSTEITAASIQREKIVRPQVLGFPIGGLDGEFDRIRMREFGLRNPEAQFDKQWGARKERLNIPLTALSPGEGHRTPIGATLEFPTIAFVHFSCTLEWQVRGLEGASLGPLYPDGVGGGAPLGTLGLYVYNRAGGTPPEQPIQGSLREIYPMETAVLASDAIRTDYTTMYAHRTMVAGTWDVNLQFVKATAAPTAGVQVSLSRIMLKIEAHL